MPINYNPTVGEVLQCDFGDNYPRTPTGEPDTSLLSTNTRLPPEMVKNRLVVVLNGKMTGGCMVVPISATQSHSTTTSKYHVPIDGKLILGHDFFASDVDCWALGEQLQQVSKLRLRPFHADASMKLVMPSELVTKIQRAVVKAINAGSLLVADGAFTALAGATNASPPSHAPMNALGAAMFAAKTKHAAIQSPAPPGDKEAA
jgi:uncharacterized protein YifN (PemK superfamily)